VRKVHRVHKERQAFRETLERKECKAFRVRKEPLEAKEQLELKAQLVHKELKAFKALKVFSLHKARLV
jgi:hypothetical protein